MKKLLTAGVTAAVMSLGGLAAAPASAEVSYNIGYMSDYIFRGIWQSESAASAGIDFEEGGFYAGTWAADVGDGLEVDLYAGYVYESGDFSVGAGFTTYQYTGDFDDTYNEVNLMIGYGMFSLSHNIGNYDTDPDDEDYTFTEITIEGESGFYGTLGSFGDDFDGEYLELGYGTEIGGFDAGISLVVTNDDLTVEGDESLVFTIGKSW